MKIVRFSRKLVNQEVLHATRNQGFSAPITACKRLTGALSIGNRRRRKAVDEALRSKHKIDSCHKKFVRLVEPLIIDIPYVCHCTRKRPGAPENIIIIPKRGYCF